MSGLNWSSTEDGQNRREEDMVVKYSPRSTWSKYVYSGNFEICSKLDRAQAGNVCGEY